MIMLRVGHQVINAVKQSIIMHCSNTTKEPKPTQIIIINKSRAYHKNTEHTAYRIYVSRDYLDKSTIQD